MPVPNQSSPRIAHALLLLATVSTSWTGSCRCPGRRSPSGTDAGAPAVPSAELPSDNPEPTASSPAPDQQASSPTGCPDEMLLIPGGRRYCIDRWEAILVDKWTGERLSPYYPVDRLLAIKLADDWDTKRKSTGSEQARAMPLPELGEWQRTHDAEPKAVSRPEQVPNGYVSGKVAALACENAGKRLCTHQEWLRACRGAANQQYPYGDAYRPGQCNVFRNTHPAAFLHNDASIGHLDPRLLLVSDRDGPLLRTTGTTPTCVSRWGDDGLHDMVGNLDEWVDDPDGKFVGGFFSRGKKDGCESKITAHPFNYFDYSLGVRCCGDAQE